MLAKVLKFMIDFDAPSSLVKEFCEYMKSKGCSAKLVGLDNCEPIRTSSDKNFLIDYGHIFVDDFEVAVWEVSFTSERGINGKWVIEEDDPEDGGFTDSLSAAVDGLGLTLPDLKSKIKTFNGG